MKLKLTASEKTALTEFLANSSDCEKLSEGEWVADLYDVDAPVSLDLVFKKDSVFADGAEYLAFDEDAKGWYLSMPVESAERVVEILRLAGAIGE